MADHAARPGDGPLDEAQSHPSIEAALPPPAEGNQTGDPTASEAQPPDASPTIITRMPPPALRPEETLAAMLRGQKLAHFEMLEPVGVGGMAAVIRARDTLLDRTVALKVLPPALAEDGEIVRRFQQEARAAARLDHENIARVFYCGEDQGLHFIAFEFVEGQDLRSIIARRGAIPAPEALGYVLQIAAGLAHAAARGVVHRDIKPSNIIVSPNGRAKLVDMGLARSLDPKADGALTQSGMTLGTFDYISPEQALEPREADVRSDIYSLGCTFYHLLTGQPPVPTGTAAKKLHHHQNVNSIDPRQLNPSIPDEVAMVLDRMMAKEPLSRFQSADELVRTLLYLAKKLGTVTDGSEGILYLDAPLPSQPRTRPWLVIAGSLAALVVLVLVLGPPASRPVLQDSGQGTGGPKTAEQKAPTEQGTSSEGVVAGKIRPGRESDTSPATARREFSVENGRELSRILRENSGGRILIKHDIRLTPDDQAVIREGDWQIDGASSAGSRPKLSLIYDARAEEAVWTGLKIQGGDVTVRGMRFEIDGRGGRVFMTALERRGGRLTVEECEFSQVGAFESGANSNCSVLVGGDGLSARADVVLRGCYFGRGGQRAVVLASAAMVQVAHCAFAPHAGPLIDLRRRDRSWLHADRNLTLKNCSILVQDAPVFETDDQGLTRLGIQQCVLSRPSRAAGEAAVILQHGEPSGTLYYSGRNNAYHNLEALMQLSGELPGQARVQDWQAFRSRPEVNDHNSDLLTVSPWESADPLGLLAREPRRAFRVNQELPSLRQEDDSAVLIGTQQCAWGKMYTESLTAIDRKPPVYRPGKDDKIVDPTLTQLDLDNTYKSLNLALNQAKPGDVILIKHTGPLPVEPMLLTNPALDVTIRAFPNYQPVLTLPRFPESDTALFKLHDGRLQLENLAFRLTPEQAAYRAQSIVMIAGYGQCSFKDCLITLDDRGVPLSAATLADPQSVMRMEGGTSPNQDARLAFENCLVRGSGNLVTVRASRAFDLKTESSLIVLAGSLLAMDGGTKELAGRGKAVITLRHVTTYLADHLLLLRAAREEMRGSRSLVTTHVAGSDCLFVSASGKPLIYLDGIDGSEFLNKFLVWESRRDAYANFVHYLAYENSPQNGMMTAAPMDERRWKLLTGDDSARFERGRQILSSHSGQTFSRASAEEFISRLDANLAGYGAAMDRLPKPRQETTPQETPGN